MLMRLFIIAPLQEEKMLHYFQMIFLKFSYDDSACPSYDAAKVNRITNKSNRVTRRVTKHTRVQLLVFLLFFILAANNYQDCD